MEPLIPIPLQSHERIDYFKREKIQIIQSKAYFTLSLDAILLADFIRLPQGRPFRYLDFCSGNGVIPLLLSARTRQPLYGVEIQAELVAMAQRSIALNHMEDRVTIYHQDVKELDGAVWGELDVISCNPPYFLVENANAFHKLSSHALARHEIALTLDQWVSKAAQLLKTKGKLFIVHRPDRLDDLMEVLLKYHFGVHRLRFIYPKAGANAKVMLIEAIYQGGRRGIKVEPPLIVHQEDNRYTSEMMAIYYGE